MAQMRLSEVQERTEDLIETNETNKGRVQQCQAHMNDCQQRADASRMALQQMQSRYQALASQYQSAASRAEEGTDLSSMRSELEAAAAELERQRDRAETDEYLLQSASRDLMDAERELDQSTHELQGQVGELQTHISEYRQRAQQADVIAGMAYGANIGSFIRQMEEIQSLANDLLNRVYRSLGMSEVAGGTTGGSSYGGGFHGGGFHGGGFSGLSGGAQSTNLSSSGSGAGEGGYSRHFTSEEAKAQYQRAIKSIDETIQNYRTELVAHGAMDGAMLTKFLAKQRADMLRYEAEEIKVARRLREPLSDEERYHYVVVGENSPYNYDNLMNEFGQFCMTDIRSWISDINPNPNNDPRRHVNCGKCAAAVYERLNGSENAVAGLGTYSISEMNSITGRIQTSMSPSAIESYLRTQGAGSHVVVGVDRENGAGHWFNAFFDGHQVYTIEGQGGVINGWPPDYGNVVHWDASV